MSDPVLPRSSEGIEREEEAARVDSVPRRVVTGRIYRDGRLLNPRI